MSLDDALQQIILVDGHLYTQKELYDEVSLAVKMFPPFGAKEEYKNSMGDEPQRCKCLRCCCWCPLFCLRNRWLRGIFKLILYIFSVLCFIAFLVYLSRKASW